ncbi:PPE domain-containing protein [Pseudonocardia alni]|uniref:PPE domain-containing protein n=1 Tax=Pseudonocardia alni TaxID=33907 RepID=UPI001AD725C1|nr:PPE domain-containing protein [Pseudonocardia alni]MBO4238783.1 PPE domain-containing protein [Pseudonocardia alni]
MAFHQGFNFAAKSLQEKYAWVVGKPGSTAVADAAAALRTADAELRSASDEARKRMAELGISWQGPAAAAAQQSLDGITTSMMCTAPVTANGATQLDAYGQSFDRTQAAIAALDPTPPGIFTSGVRSLHLLASTPLTGLSATVADYVISLERDQRHSEEADRALQEHLDTASAIDDRFRTVDPGSAATPTGAGGPAPGSAGAGGPGPAGVGAGGGATPPGGDGPATGVPGQPGGGSRPGPDGVGAPGRPGTDGPGTEGSGLVGSGPGTPDVGRTAEPGAAGTTGGGVADRDRGTGLLGPVDVVAPQHLDPTATPAPDPYRPAAPPGPYPTTTPGPDPLATRVELGHRFGERTRAQPLLPPSARGPGYGDRLRGGTGPGGGRPHEQFGPGARTAEPAWSARPGETTGRGGAPGGYGPMAGGAGSRDTRDHRNRYVVPTDEVFDIEIAATDAVLAPEEPHR